MIQHLIHIQRFALLLFLSALLVGCTEPYTLPKEKVKATLLEYAATHPQNEIEIITALGTIKVRLFDDTPLHRANFLRMIELGYYSKESQFHRVIPSFMIQGGNTRAPEPGHLLPAEISQAHFHRRGALAMARRETNPEMASNAGDFYIVTGEGWRAESLAELAISPQDPRYAIYLKEGGYPYLDGKYSVFGQVTTGMHIVDSISSMRTQNEHPLKTVSFEVVATSK
jgi:cyclophilin family peptidyl-prolyl cis-trans isomerase